MIILTDTCFWSHSKEIHDAGILDIREILLEYRWGYTPSVQEEINYWGLDDFIKESIAIMFPVSQKEIQSLTSQDPLLESLDQADQELLIACRRESGLILSDDGELLMEATAAVLPALSLPVFILKNTEEGTIEKRMMARCLKLWEDKHRYKKKQISRWGKELQEIR